MLGVTWGEGRGRGRENPLWQFAMRTTVLGSRGGGVADQQPFSQINKEHFDTLLGVLKRYPEELGAYLKTCGYEPQPGSRAEAELRQYGNADAVQTAYSQAAIAQEVAGDHIFGLHRSLAEPPLVSSSWSCARGVLENASRVVYLLDRSIDVDDRVLRGLSFRYHDVTEQTKFYKESKDDRAEDDARVRIRKIREIAEHRGLTLKKAPPRIELARLALNAGGAYRLLPAMSHGETWGYLGLGSRRTGKDGRFIEKIVTREAIEFLVGSSVAWLSRAAWEQVTLFGWPFQPAVNLMESAYNSIGLNISMRFWRDDLRRR